MEYPYTFSMFMNSQNLAVDDNIETEFLKDYKEHEKELLSTLTKKQQELFSSFKYDYQMHMLEIRDKDVMKVIFESFKIGQEFQDYMNHKYDE